MQTSKYLTEETLNWLLEEDKAQPAIRYFTLRDILGYDKSDPQVVKAYKDIMLSGPIPKILSAQNPEGHWQKPGAGYSTKYRGTIWQIIFLASFGADKENPQVKKACEYVLTHAISPIGGFGYNGTPSGFIHCHSGNLCSSLIDLGYLEDERLQKAIEWQARLITGEGVSSLDSTSEKRRFYRYTPAPGFVCGPNGDKPCAWGAVKALKALGKVPPEKRTEIMNKAIEEGTKFLFGVDPAEAKYPTRLDIKPSSSWFKFSFPPAYVTDVLENAEVLVSLGFAGDGRMANTFKLISEKQNEQGKWLLERTSNGKMWVDIEEKGKPSKWITLNALKVLKHRPN